MKTSPAIMIAAATALLTGCFEPTEVRIEQKRDGEYQFAWDVLNAYLIFQDSLPGDPYVYATPQALYASVNEPYTVYFDPELAALFLSQLTTQSPRGAMGIRVDSVYNGYLVKKVYAGTPADKSGLQKNDTILAVDNQAIAGVALQRLSEYTSGDPGQIKELSVKRGPQTILLTITLEQILLPSVWVDSLDSITAYVELGMFSDSTIIAGGSAAEFDSALSETKWAKYTIFDLRDNPGGELKQCIRITSEFLENNTPIVKSSERNLNSNGSAFITADTVWRSIGDGDAVTRTFMVLVNNNSASAAEIVVSALHSNRDDILTIGTTTFGKARGQIAAGTPQDGIAKVTFSLITPVSGPAYDEVGIEPKITISPAEDALQVALDQIHAGSGIAKKSILRYNKLVKRINAQRKMHRMKTRIPLLIKRI
ncbi:MAG: PDZ domain-containing protein [Chitinivibrionales bacterium]|nr:PDZ domain-containing protein [Chitinivibrionales bacterium]